MRSAIGENIALGNIAESENLEKIEIAAEKSGIADRIKRLESGYQTPLGKQFSGTELSGGEWQKIAIARAFIRQEKAQILVLDEPTAALDPRSEYEIYNRFSELVTGKMAIFSNSSFSFSQNERSHYSLKIWQTDRNWQPRRIIKIRRRIC